VRKRSTGRSSTKMEPSSPGHPKSSAVYKAEAGSSNFLPPMIRAAPSPWAEARPKKATVRIQIIMRLAL